ncbi:nuclear transport factor 2 family protein [Mariniflexile sp. AS56]|uniref:nuclear transport factor 2 family protein n=1 Tax=Mariniflexile sp. AS56 TaxID=3063957 RepID=UPI0026EEA24E|nr:nuclear transport factor 2 family protein [Mariniflexile sp. AS56]MDO7173661.1 nuclear transport factor 2 family protein [Mariniflexile sp. AS56]
MKKQAILIMLLFTVVMYSQKKKNGTIYSEHPAITVVEAMQQAFIKGDTAKVSNYLAKEFRAINGMNSNPDSKGSDKKAFLNQSIFWNDNASYLSIKRSGEAYPDALEYDKSGTWVQTWDYLRGIHSKTGVKLDMQLHRLFIVNKDNKIARMISYDDGSVFDEIRNGFASRTNGTIYNQHENINKVRMMMGALEHGDVDKGFSFFAENAQFTNLDMGKDESYTVAEEKVAFKKMLESYTIESFDVVGYPDYLEYEIGNGKVVQSWWNARFIRKSDGKKVQMPVMLTHDFNDEGLITREIGYYTTRLLQAK